MDRRVLITLVSSTCCIGAVLGMVGWESYHTLLIAAFLVGGMSNPLYSLLIAHTNDFVDFDDMVAASSGLLFIHGIGAISGPLIVGWVLGQFGPTGFFLVISIFVAVLSCYAIYRMTQRAAVTVAESGFYAPVGPTASPVALEIAQEYAIEVSSEEENS
jgi:MFS family permease